MGMLPDRLWRRVIELFLLAGQNGEDGELPSVAEIAWQLNRTVQVINADLQKIAETGIVEQKPDGSWIVTNFKKRNAPVDGTKRIKDFRTRERYEKGNADVTVAAEKCNADVTEVKRECNEALQLRYQEEQKNRRTEDQTEKDKETAAAAAFYEANFGVLSSVIATEIDKAISETSLDWVLDAMREAVTHDVRKWSYVAKVLSTWKGNGRKGARVNSSNPKKDQDVLQEKFRALYQAQKQQQSNQSTGA